jgi:CO/xanthine dehydrogenase Mo-binding subunit
MSEKDSSVSRRTFLQGTAGGLVLSFSLTGGGSAQEEEEESLPGSLEGHPQLDSWISINADGTVTVTTGKVELGQGIKSAVAQIAAEELNVAYERTNVETADTVDSPNEGYTAGSGSMEQSGTAIRYAAAEAKDVLLGLAAGELGAAKSELTVEDGRVSAPGGAETTYWNLLGGRYLEREATGEVEPESPDDYSIVNSERDRLDIPGKLTGEESYVHDVRRPGMLHGRVVRPPTYGAELDSVDASSAQDMEGVVSVVRDGAFLGVVAEQEWQAIRAMETLRESAQWTTSETMPAKDRIYDYLVQKSSHDEELEEYGHVTLDNRDRVDGTLENAETTLEAEYRKPYIMHASMGPSCAVAEYEGDQLTVWTHSQGIYPLRTALSDLLRKPEEEIRCVHREGAGCYGHNGADDVAGDAALLSRAVDGRPVRVQWTREDEHRWEPYGSAMVMRPRGGLDADGNVVGLDYGVWSHAYSTRPPGTPLLAGWHVEEEVEGEPPWRGGGARDSVPTYDIPNLRSTNHYLPNSPLRVSALRSLGSYGNVFALESFVDELAVEAGADPVEFRLGHMSNDREYAVIREAANLANWGEADLGENSGRGIAYNHYENSSAMTAVVAEVTVNPDSGEVQVDRLLAANDSGQIVSPDGLRSQLVGGMLQSASWTLHEEVQFDTERIQSQDWQSYPIMTFSEVPETKVSLINRPGEPYLGTGEATQGPTPAAIGNAIYDAVGVRLRETPLTPERVQAAME